MYLFLLTVAIACGKKHSSVLSLNDMKTVMWDMLNADSWYAQTALRDTTGNLNKKNIEWYGQIFVQHDITKEQFYKSYSYYEARPEKMKLLMDSIEAYGTRTKMNLDHIPVVLPSTKQNIHKL